MMSALPLRFGLASARRFVGWWAAELSDALATRPRQPNLWRIMFLRRGQGCEVFVRTREGIERVATADTPSGELQADLGRRFATRKGPNGPIVLRLSPSEVVETRTSVPVAARDVMVPILRNQIERLAPWPVENALFAYKVVDDTGDTGTLTVELIVTGRNVVDGLVAELESLGYAPDIVDTGTDASTEPRINLLPGQSHEVGRSGQLLISFVGIAMALSLVAGAVGVVGLVQRTHELTELNAKLEDLRVKSKSDRIEGYVRLQRRQTLLAAEKHSHPSMAIMIEALSRALPDDAWLSGIEASQGSVTLTGHATNVAALIGMIEASQHFTDVAFSGPTTRAAGQTQESFTITAKMLTAKELN